MKIRAVTIGVSLDQGLTTARERISRAASIGHIVKTALEQAGYEVRARFSYTHVLLL